MVRRFTIATLLFAAACSQRAPYRVIPASPRSAPAPSTTPTRSANGGDDRASTSDITLSAIAVLPSVNGASMPSDLLFPVPGVESSRLEDSFDAPRDGGRRHGAIDIMAPRGTPVLSVQDGHILRLSKNSNGGITVYAADLNDQFVYYYAHLDRYHPSVYAGRPLLRGDTLGYVGTSGNAPKDTPHLHLQVMRMPADRKFWNGEPINPYPLLVRSTAAAVAP